MATLLTELWGSLCPHPLPASLVTIIGEYGGICKVTCFLDILRYNQTLRDLPTTLGAHRTLEELFRDKSSIEPLPSLLHTAYICRPCSKCATMDLVRWTPLFYNVTNRKKVYCGTNSTRGGRLYHFSEAHGNNITAYTITVCSGCLGDYGLTDHSPCRVSNCGACLDVTRYNLTPLTILNVGQVCTQKGH